MAKSLCNLISLVYSSLYVAHGDIDVLAEPPFFNINPTNIQMH